jgi:hypothetical protein
VEPPGPALGEGQRLLGHLPVAHAPELFVRDALNQIGHCSQPEVATMAKHSRENGADLFAMPFALMRRRQKMVSEPYIVVDLDQHSVERRILDQLAKAPPLGSARWNGRLVAEALGDVSDDAVWHGKEKEIHVILDNLNTDKPKNDRWLKSHPNVHLHFTPTHTS